MRSYRQRLLYCALLGATTIPLALVGPARALPVYARRYGVDCSACHSVAPRLNTFGQAFQANLLNWPAPRAPRPKSMLGRIPISGLATASSEHDLTHEVDSTDFRMLEIFLTGGFQLSPHRQGGYLVDDIAVIKDGATGDLDNAFVSVPFAGSKGQFAATVGQFRPLMYQYDPLNRLTRTLPGALENAVDAFALADATPGLRLDFYDRRGEGTSDGNYLDLGVPFQGHLTARSDAAIHGTRGLYMHAFHRIGYSSLGAFGFKHGSSYRVGLLGTKELHRDLYFTGAASSGHDAFGGHHVLSAQADYTPSRWLAFTGRLDAQAGEEHGLVPVAAVTYYPFRQSVFRLSGETVQQEGNRTVGLFFFAQF